MNTSTSTTKAWKDWFNAQESATTINKIAQERLFKIFDSSISVDRCKNEIEGHTETAFLFRQNFGQNRIGIFHHMKSVGGNIYVEKEDFGFILGRDPKPFPPPMKLSKEMMEPMVPGSAYHKQFKNYCFTAFLSLRRQSNLFLSIMQLMQSSDIPDIALEPEKCLLTVQQNFVLSKDEDQAVAHVQNLLDQSLNAVFAVMVEELHKLAMYFRR